ncbi:phosphoethanolamine--lipid A transferase [Lysobacter pythonis]|uniref:Phosphoethanolamine--lipid A transferase n=1 Tax=Solilutibacter pythonis TaxID=2483112 RepID=A0A3M2HPF2_9GAMM|nr:phosphoethanolamine--lipid A transferase [Lysobacter pythonis]RMH88117.1 phosphoethanolamine--lipid A transferase [Lysobacter pythonis]
MPDLRRFRPTLSANAVMALAALWMTLFSNQRLWGLIYAAPFDSPLSTWLFRAVMAALVFAFALMMILPFSFKGALKPWLAFLLVAAASANVLTVDFGAVADRHAIASVFETDRREAGEMMSPWVLARIFATGVLPALLVFWTKIAWKPFGRELLARWKPLAGVIAPIAIAIAGFGQQVIPFVRNHPPVRYLTLPFSTLSASAGYLQHAVEGNRPHTQIGPDARRVHGAEAGRKPRVLVVVVGESARSESFALDGYARDTTPELAKLPVLFFGNIASCGTNTATSLPCMFSDLVRGNYRQKVANTRDNALDLLARAGWQVEWIDNNTGSKKVATRVKETPVMSSTDSRWCVKEGCHDELLVDKLQKRLTDIGQDTVIVLHTLGSHGPAYYARYPQAFARFQPECRSTQLQRCARQSIVNTYDNSILYTDHVLARMIDALQADTAIDPTLLYLSDHGESTGEKGLYLHGAPYAFAPSQQTRVPMILWVSPGYAKGIGLDLDCLAGKTGGTYSHDNFFDSLLGFGDVASDAQRAQLDITRSCRS